MSSFLHGFSQVCNAVLEITRTWALDLREGGGGISPVGGVNVLSLLYIGHCGFKFKRGP